MFEAQVCLHMQNVSYISGKGHSEKPKGGVDNLPDSISLTQMHL